MSAGYAKVSNRNIKSVNTWICNPLAKKNSGFPNPLNTPTKVTQTHKQNIVCKRVTLKRVDEKSAEETTSGLLNRRNVFVT